MVEAVDAEADGERAAALERYFQVRPGGYGEGDRFIGVQLSRLRVLARPYRTVDIPVEAFEAVLASPVHEHRLAALVVMAEHAMSAARAASRAASDGDARLTELAGCYLRSTARVNNWDLVDCSAAPVLGSRLLDRPRDVLTELMRSRSVWERRIAVVSTHRFIRAGQTADTFALAEMAIADRHDLVHKAAGWMLREAGKRVDADALRTFLDTHAAAMPRTMLRYAVEHLPAETRAHYRQQS